MTYQIEIYRFGELRCQIPWRGTLVGAQGIAKSNIRRGEADFVRVVDIDGSGAEVWSERVADGE